MENIETDFKWRSQKIKAIFSTEIQVTIPLRSSSEVYTPKDCAYVDCCKHVGLKNDNCKQLQLEGRINLYWILGVYKGQTSFKTFKLTVFATQGIIYFILLSHIRVVMHINLSGKNLMTVWHNRPTFSSYADASSSDEEDSSNFTSLENKYKRAKSNPNGQTAFTLTLSVNKGRLAMFPKSEVRFARKHEHFSKICLKVLWSFAFFPRFGLQVEVPRILAHALRKCWEK